MWLPRRMWSRKSIWNSIFSWIIPGRQWNRPRWMWTNWGQMPWKIWNPFGMKIRLRSMPHHCHQTLKLMAKKLSINRRRNFSRTSAENLNQSDRLRTLSVDQEKWMFRHWLMLWNLLIWSEELAPPTNTNRSSSNNTYTKCLQTQYRNITTYFIRFSTGRNWAKFLCIFSV